MNAPEIRAAITETTGPSFVVGQDDDGHWIVIETRGHGGGLFASRDAAIRYAAFETDHRVGAVVLSPQPLRLSLG